MNVYFFDTSALLKRYHSELGTETVDAAFEEKDATWNNSVFRTPCYCSPYLLAGCSMLSAPNALRLWLLALAVAKFAIRNPQFEMFFLTSDC